MLDYFQGNRKLSVKGDIELILKEMRPWYGNYCFTTECSKDECIYNCDMALQYLQHQKTYDYTVKEIVDKNASFYYEKLRMLTGIWENRRSVIEDLAATGTIRVDLKTSFPAEYITEDENFRSLLYYYGLVTMRRQKGLFIEMVIPNHCVREQYWSFMRDYSNQTKPATRTSSTVTSWS